MAGRTRKQNPAAPQAAPQVSPAPVETPAPEPNAEPVAQPAVEPEGASEAASRASAAPAETPAPVAPSAGDAKAEILGRAHRALSEGIDALDEVARSGAFLAASPAEQAIVAAAEQGFRAIRAAFEGAQTALAEATSFLRYEGLERRSFTLVKDVLLDGTNYGPLGENPAPLTQGQHAQLKAAQAVEGEWDDGEAADG